MTLISVVIPAFNAERTILQTIESVQKQTFTNLEIIVVNDGSSDRTLELLETIKDDRLKVYSYLNGRVPTARNRGIACATGDYISFLDADDMWTEDKLEKQLAALQQHPEAIAAYSWIVNMIEPEDNPEKATFYSARKVDFTGDIFPQLLLENFIGNGSNILVKKAAVDSIGGFDPLLESCEDWDYYLRLAAKWSFILVPEHQIIYRKSIGIETITSDINRLETKGILTIEKAFKTASAQLQHLKNRSLSNYYFFCSKLYYDRSNHSENLTKARQRLWNSIRLYPTSLLHRDTQILTIRVILKQFVPTNLKRYLFSLFVHFEEIKDPRH